MAAATEGGAQGCKTDQFGPTFGPGGDGGPDPFTIETIADVMGDCGGSGGGGGGGGGSEGGVHLSGGGIWNPDPIPPGPVGSPIFGVGGLFHGGGGGSSSGNPPQPPDDPKKDLKNALSQIGSFVSAVSGLLGWGDSAYQFLMWYSNNILQKLTQDSADKLQEPFQVILNILNDLEGLKLTTKLANDILGDQLAGQAQELLDELLGSIGLSDALIETISTLSIGSIEAILLVGALILALFSAYQLGKVTAKYVDQWLTGSQSYLNTLLGNWSDKQIQSLLRQLGIPHGFAWP